MHIAATARVEDDNTVLYVARSFERADSTHRKKDGRVRVRSALHPSRLVWQDELFAEVHAVRTLFSRALAAFVLVLVPAIAAAAPVGPETILAIPHYPNETCAKIRADGVYQVQVCWTSDPIRTVEDWTRTALSADDGWRDDASGRERIRNGLLQSVDFGEPRIIKYFARDITS